VIRTRHVFHEDIAGPESRRVLEWSLARGGDAFTVSVIGSPGGPDEVERELRSRLAPYALAPGTVRAIPKPEPGSYWTRPADLWRLTPESAEVLWAALDEDLLTYYPGRAEWCEDPIIYRSGELLLGVISHEQEGVLRVDREDEASLHAARIPFRAEGRWVGY
jgi:hypothetical protein